MLFRIIPDAIRLDDQDAEVYAARGCTFYNVKNYDTAIANFNVALQLNPEYALPYLVRGKSKYRSVDNDGACSDWKIAAELGNQEAKKLLDENCNQ